MNLWTAALLVVVSLALGAGAWLLFLWSVRSGQMDDVEAPKHRMLDDDEDDPPPPPPTPPRGSSGGSPGAP